jgi:[glutamine synthetase] adenylyltransferase / [glutamine synthetase]-adenylyl-L-tyrosine phosphorylase
LVNGESIAATAADSGAKRALQRLRAAGATPAVPAAALATVLAASEFVAEALLADPELVARPDAVEPAPFAPAAALTDEAAFMTALRRARRRALARVAWRDLTGVADTAATLAALSALADEAIRVACAFADRQLGQRYGVPRDGEGRAQPFVVVGMGKLGGGELNFSSDVDLIFLYPEGGETDGRRAIDNFEYFTRFGQKLIQLLDATTVDGFVYRVDVRLRPFGDSGPLVSSFAALEGYLQEHGRDWERYAWIKARAITGVAEYAQLFENVVRPFVFRRYLDFGVIESLREMKRLISREVERRELDHNIKLGRGGIREIEFIVQALQLVRGGSDARLRAASLLSVLPRLAGQKLLPEAAVRELEAAYDLLRRVENRLQMYRDEQIHGLPQDAERRASLVAAMGSVDWPALQAEIDAQRDVVARHFAALVLAGGGAAPADNDFESAFAGSAPRTELAGALESLGVVAPAAIAALLVALKESGYYRRLDEPGRRRLHALLPRLVAAASRQAEPTECVRRALSVVEAIGTRTAYLALLNENPLALARLIEICALGSFLPAQVAAFPLLLDELVDQRLFEESPSRAQLTEELELRAAAEPEDEERSIELLRQFQRAAVFRVALFDLTERLPIMQVSDRLTDIAELILARAMAHGWRAMTALYGEPACGTGAARRTCGVAAVGYGKLGGHELGYGSDLDIVFLHDSAGEQQETVGPKVIDNAVFFLRLGQKIVHLLTIHTAAGRLYEVDMRLRPSGKGGMLVTQFDAFVDYQRADAWTWEHQALLHARAVAGSPALRARFEAVRLEVLCNHVHRDTLRSEVRSMRERMRKELSRGDASRFDIKQDPGGVADIEFLAQYWALKWAREYPPVAVFSDTIRQLESVASADLVPQATVDILTQAYRAYRATVHHLSLDDAVALAPATDFSAMRAAVTHVWDTTMADEP